MKNIIKIVVVVVLLITTSSFTNKIKYDFIGTYGVPDNDPAQIKLTLLDDHTFIYQDFSNPQKKIDVKGNWELKGKLVVLKDHNSQYSFHNKWKFLKDGQVAKSRKGMTYYSLCRL
ncbi:MAG: hypothetical protein Q8L81_17005 [Bacteroidota bacterium]|nr:hypothetical protein [Bacteroidota bacterium]